MDIVMISLTGSLLSELSNIISTKAEITRGPVPSCWGRNSAVSLNLP